MFLALLVLVGTGALGVVGLLTDEMTDRSGVFRDESLAAFSIVAGELQGDQ